MRLANYVYFENFLSEQECNKLIKAKQNDLQNAELGTGGQGIIDPKSRKTNVSFVENNSPVHDLIIRICDQICFASQKYYGRPATAFEPIQYAEYEKDMFFSWHVDCPTAIDEIEICKRDISASLILNKKEEYTGGSLQFIGPGAVSKNNKLIPEDAVKQEQGTLIVFPSTMIHQVTKIKSGTRKSLVAWGWAE
jgi:PKHD-type hydroxylase